MGATKMNDNRKMSEIKELFMAMCMLSGCVSDTVSRQLKKKYGESIKKTIIYKLASKGYIKRLGNNKSYDYVLTQSGYDYFKSKVGNKYNSITFTLNSAQTYNIYAKERNRALCSVLFFMYQKGVDITNNYEQVKKLLNGNFCEIKKPFFITAKEMRMSHIKFNTVKGSRFYGLLFTKDQIITVYSPDEEHQLYVKTEKTLHTLIKELFSITSYNKPQNFSNLFIYHTRKELKSSFFTDITNYKNHKMSTRGYYLQNEVSNNYIYLSDEDIYNFNDILDLDRKKAINEVFIQYYEVEKIRKTIKIVFADGAYTDENTGEKFLMINAWDINPHKICQILRYIRNRERSRDRETAAYSDKCMICCYEEEFEVLNEILSINKRTQSKIMVGAVKRNEIYKLCTAYRN